MLGMDGMRLLTTGDPVESYAMQAVAEEAASLLKQRDRALAAEIANAVGHLFK
jgi:hypothetical protein